MEKAPIDAPSPEAAPKGGLLEQCLKRVETMGGAVIRYQRYAKNALFGLSLLAASGSAGSLPTKEAQESRLAQWQKAEQVDERLGFNLAEIANENGFYSRVAVDNGSGSYIVHVGQRHLFNARKLEDNTEITGDQKALKSQQSIYNTLKKIAEQKAEQKSEPLKVYYEGFVPEVIEHITVIRKLVLTTKSLPYSAESLPQLKTIDQQLTDFSATSDAPIKIARSIILEKINRIIEIDNEVINSDPDPTIRDFINIFKIRVKLQFIPPEDLVSYGAGLTLFLEGGNIDLLPAEDLQLNEEAGRVVHELEAFEKNAATLPEEQMMRMFKRLQHDLENIVMRQREDFGVKKISEKHSPDDNPDLVLIVYGSDHDFSDNIEKHNQNHPENKYGLIDLSFVEEEAG